MNKKKRWYIQKQRFLTIINKTMNDDILNEEIEEIVYVPEGSLCPSCEMELVEGQTFGFEKEVMCPHCDYFATKTLEL